LQADVLHESARAGAEQIALETREELKLTATERLDPCELAEYLGIELVPMDAYGDEAADAIEQLTEGECYVFSAVTYVARDSRLKIVYNSAHSPRRHANTISHELAHILLEHKPHMLFDARGRLVMVPGEELEAEYLAGALLAPRCAVLPVLHRFSGATGRAAEHFGISKNLMIERIKAAEAMPSLAEAEVAAMLRMTEEDTGVLRRARLSGGFLNDTEIGAVAR
jgi:Zn-dependent peptidase ImmA (M78 family)